MKETRWFEKYRMEWIAETLRIFGFINREHLMLKFGISAPQAAKDFAAFLKLNPDAMHYDTSLKKYIANSSINKRIYKQYVL